MATGKRITELSDKNVEIARLTEEVTELERKAMEQIRVNESLKEEHVR
jgi:hypothetical protein